MAFALLGQGSSLIYAEDMPGKMDAVAPAEMSPEDQEMMAKWQEFSTPNENHKALDTLAGNWNHTVKWWMKPDTEPEISTGTGTAEWIMGGRYLQQKVSGMSMGQPFEGLGIIGYDNANKEYVSIWLDNMGTGLMQSTAQYDTAAKTFAEKGSHSCFLAEDGHRKYRATTKIIDNDNYVYEMFSTDEAGKEFRAMEITYTRTK